MRTRRELLLAGIAVAASPAGSGAPLLDDTGFERGAVVWKPEAGKKVIAGSIRPVAGRGDPAWGLAQWHSRFSLAAAKPERTAAGGTRFFDGAKTVVFGAPGGPEADVILGLDGFTEYGGRTPQPGDAWPHLLLERALLRQPAITDLQALRLRLNLRLLESDVRRGEGFNARRHTAQFQFYLTVRNANPESRGFRDYFWFGVQMYDARHRFPPHYAAKDLGTDRKPGTGKFIFNPAGDRFSARSTHDGEWVAIDSDLLPMMREGLETAWIRGYLLDSRKPEDYSLGSMNVGWEVTGTIKVTMQMRGLSLSAG